MYIYVHCTTVPYSIKLLREKTLANFAILWLFVKVFSVKFGGVVFFGAAKVSNPRKFSLRKIVFSPIRESFLSQKFMLFSTITSILVYYSILTLLPYLQGRPPPQ